MHTAYASSELRASSLAAARRPVRAA